VCNLVLITGVVSLCKFLYFGYKTVSLLILV
jgi:hypothetical protein